MSLTELLGHVGIFGGAVMVCLALLSVFSVGMIIDKHRRFGLASRQSEKFKPQFKKFLHGGDVQDLIEAGKLHENSHVAQVVSAGIIEYDGVRQSGGDPVASLELVTSALRDSISETLIQLKRGLGFLATIGSTAPFIGLFGTVVGIINAFRSIAATGSGGMSVVSGGIAEALISTALGIFVAIPAVVAFNHFTGKIETFHVQMNRASSQLVNCLFKIPELKELDAEVDEVKASRVKKEGPGRQPAEHDETERAGRRERPNPGLHRRGWRAVDQRSARRSRAFRRSPQRCGGRRAEPQGRDPRRCKAQFPRGPGGHGRDRTGRLPRGGADRQARRRRRKVTSCSSTATIPAPVCTLKSTSRRSSTWCSCC